MDKSTVHILQKKIGQLKVKDSTEREGRDLLLSI